MKVLVLTTSYPEPDDPLPGTFVREHALAVAQRFDVAVLHLARGRRAGVTSTVDAGLRVCRVGYPGRPLPLSLAAHFAAAAAGLRTLRRSGFVPDLVHAHFFLAALPAVLLARRPVITTEHWTIFLPEDPARLSGPFLHAARLAYRRSCFVLPVSEALRDGLLAHGVDARFAVVPNAVDTTLFHPGDGARERPPRLVTVSTLTNQKRVDELFRAFALVRAGGSDAHLDVVGDGPERAALESLASGLELDVTFHGARRKEEVAEIIRGASLFVLASHFESNGVAVLEALASGLPVVGYALPALEEIIDDTGGRLVPRGHVEALADAIGGALAGDLRYDPARIAARARDRYGREAVARQLAAVYEQCLAP